MSLTRVLGTMTHGHRPYRTSHPGTAVASSSELDCFGDRHTHRLYTSLSSAISTGDPCHHDLPSMAQRRRPATSASPISSCAAGRGRWLAGTGAARSRRPRRRPSSSPPCRRTPQTPAHRYGMRDALWYEYPKLTMFMAHASLCSEHDGPRYRCSPGQAVATALLQLCRRSSYVPRMRRSWFWRSSTRPECVPFDPRGTCFSRWMEWPSDVRNTNQCWSNVRPALPHSVRVEMLSP